MSEATFHVTKEDIRKPESSIAKARGSVPANSNVSAMKVTTKIFLFYPFYVQYLTKYSPLSTPIPTNPNKSTRANPTSLCPNSRRQPATGTHSTNVLSTSALVALRPMYLARATALCGDLPPRRAVCVLMDRSITSLRSRQVMLGDRARRG
jgi:hypothetical protein